MNRQELVRQLNQNWDVVVIGGGITGAGIFRLASLRGLKTLLLEQRDYAWGTSSRSGKMVHGGLRYIAQGQIRSSLHSVVEREKLLKIYAGLVNPHSFILATPKGGFVMKWGLGAVLTIYDWMAGRQNHTYYRDEDFRNLAPGIISNGTGGFSFIDGTTDDSRLVMRVLHEGQAAGGTALNYMEVKELCRTNDGRVQGVSVEDLESGEQHEITAKVVINAAGAWVDDFLTSLGHPPRIRKLRGGHLLFPHHRLPLDAAVGLISPRDGRSMYVLPWEGVTLLGTTDLDHEPSMKEEPQITAHEGEYLLETVNHWFPEAKLTKDDVISTMAGVRPVVNTGKKNPSKESREETVWKDKGLITISGGKLTTFPLMARKTLDAASKWLDSGSGSAPIDPNTNGSGLDLDGRDPDQARIFGRYGDDASAFLDLGSENGLEKIGDTNFFWSELKWAARNEQVLHLEDLMFRRTRIGLILPDGGLELLEKVRETVQSDLGWDDEKWASEESAYRKVWRQAYSPDLIA